MDFAETAEGYTDSIAQPPSDARPVPAEVTIGLIAAPGLAADLAEDVATQLVRTLATHYPAADWRTRIVVDGLVPASAPTTELVDAAHRRLLAEDWEMAICLTDVPLRIGRRPLAGHASPTHRVALVSVPALGPRNVAGRAAETALGMLQVLLDLPPDLPTSDGRVSDPRLQQRLVDLSELADEDPEHGPTGLAALASGGRLRLLVGMLRANRPWRLTTRLYRALVAALATAAFALVTSDVWIIAESLDLVRLALVAALSVGVTVASLIAVHALWERSGPGTARDQILLFNAATTATVLVGIASLYAVLFVVSLIAAGLLITTDVLSQAVGTSTGWPEYLKLAWLTSSLATVGGALGAGLESDDAIRQAAYAYRPESKPAWSEAAAR
jgi:hypothetical protein